MRAVSAQGEAKRGQQRDERLAFAGGHLDERPVGEREAGEELDVVGGEAVRAADAFGDERDGLALGIRQRLARRRGGALAQAGVGSSAASPARRAA